MKLFSNTVLVSALVLLLGTNANAQKAATQERFAVPVLKGKDMNPVLRIIIDAQKDTELQEVVLDLKGTSSIGDIDQLSVSFAGSDSTILKPEKLMAAPKFAVVNDPKSNRVILKGKTTLSKGRNYLWVSAMLDNAADLHNRLSVSAASVMLNDAAIRIASDKPAFKNRLGVAVRQHNDDQVHTYRIPGLATANDGTLLAVYDVRRESARDLQGDIDIGLSRSNDKGKTWLPMQIVLDMKEWGGLPEKFNGVSDACVLVDKKTGHIYVAGLWMYGVINEKGEWVEGLTKDSTVWNHQWRNKGSQPGFDVKQTSQFLIVKSEDNGKTWGKPVNLTKMCKKEEWWLWAPAPGQGITLKDGTLVFPTQGRDKNGESFSNITYSKDGGKTWVTTNPAVKESTTENMAVELSDGSVMLNMRANSNRTNPGSNNGRAIAITRDLGVTWQEHATSKNALPEPTCMASIIRHDFIKDGVRKSVLLFSNPDSKTQRNNMTIKISHDDGKTWSDKKILLDEWRSRGYSCLTSIDKDTIGILYESSLADMVFQSIKLSDLL